MNEMSQSLLNILKKARVDINTLPSCPGELSDIMSEISLDIDRIEFDLQGNSKRDADWESRARLALLGKKREFVAVRQYRDFVKKQKAESHEVRQLKERIASYEKKVRNLALSYERKNYECNGIVKFALSAHPEMRESFHALQDKLRIEFNERNPA